MLADDFTRIYTAGSVREVKKGAIQTMVIGFVFYVPLMVVALCAAPLALAQRDPSSAFFAIAEDAGGTWLLAVALLIVFAASMGFVDGVIQAMGTQVANDIVDVIRPLRDKEGLVIAKGAMAIFAITGGVMAFQMYDWADLANLAQLSYQAIVQLAVPIFVGLFWSRGNKSGALAGLVIGTVTSLALTWPYFSTGGALPYLGGLGSGLVGLAANLVVYVAVSCIMPSNSSERSRVLGLFNRAQAPGRLAAGDLATEPM